MSSEHVMAQRENGSEISFVDQSPATVVEVPMYVVQHLPCQHVNVSGAG